MLSQQAQRELTATARGLTSEMERIEPGTADWARAASLAFSFHVSAPVSERPFWWTDEALLALSARIVRILPEDASAWAMRGQILAARTFLGIGKGTPWLTGARSTEQLREASDCFGKAAKMPPTLGSPHVDSHDLEAYRRECVRIADRRTAGGASTSSWEQAPLQPATLVPGHSGELDELTYEDEYVGLPDLIRAMLADIPAPGKSDSVMPAAYDDPGLVLPTSALAVDEDPEEALELATRALAVARGERGAFVGPREESLLERALGTGTREGAASARGLNELLNAEGHTRPST